MKESTRMVAVKDQVSCDLDGETAILNLKTGVYFTLNEVGAFVWARMQDSTTFGTLCDAVTLDYEVSRAQCEADLKALLADLRDHGLVECAE